MGLNVRTLVEQFLALHDIAEYTGRLEFRDMYPRRSTATANESARARLTDELEHLVNEAIGQAFLGFEAQRRTIKIKGASSPEEFFCRYREGDWECILVEPHTHDRKGDAVFPGERWIP